MYHRLLIRLICLALALLATPQVRADAELDALLAKVFETYGGTQVISQTQIIHQKGRTYSSLRGAEGDIERLLHHPDHLKVVIEYPSGAENRVLAGEQAWKQGKQTSGPFRMAMRLQAGRIWLPRTLWDHKDQARHVGRLKTENGTEREFVDIPLGEDMTISVEIDPVSGRILKSRGTLQMGGMAMVFGTEYADFRMQDGRLFAFKETHYAMGRPTGHTRIEKLSFPVALKKGQVLL